jgi:TonB-dependent SusC/RagA subfamily outer membrane receptor
MKKLIFISVLFIWWACCPNWVEGQNRTVYGKLTLFNTYPVSNLEVAAKKAKTVAVTDSSGWFALECAEKDIIMIRSEVFSPVNLRLNERTDTVLLNLIFLDQGDNRELATGFGYIRQEDLTFAMNHLGYQNNDFCNYNNIYDLIEGRFPGVIVESDGNDGAIYIRGSSSAGASNNALTVVDGIITGGIGWINPCDVKSINIMKDGMTAMYGSDGSNGVVVIETHRGATR